MARPVADGIDRRGVCGGKAAAAAEPVTAPGWRRLDCERRPDREGRDPPGIDVEVEACTPAPSSMTLPLRGFEPGAAGGDDVLENAGSALRLGVANLASIVNTKAPARLRVSKKG